MDNNFVSTAHMHAGDTSVDTSEDIHRHSETQDVRKTFGEVEPVPDLDDEPPPRFTENDPVELEEDFDDAGLGAGGGVLHDLRAPTAEEEERFAAAGVAQRARAQGRDSSGVLDALEAAEAAHDAKQGGGGAGDADADGPASKRLRVSGEGTTASRPPAEAADMPTRQRVVAKLAEALEGNAQFTEDAEASACEAEAHLFARAPHRHAANALRVAKTATSLTELVRIATGEPKADVVQHQPDEDVRVLPEQFGLAGTVELARRRDSLQGEELAERRGDLHNDLDMDNDLPVEQEGRNHVTKEQPQD